MADARSSLRPLIAKKKLEVKAREVLVHSVKRSVAGARRRQLMGPHADNNAAPRWWWELSTLARLRRLCSTLV